MYVVFDKCEEKPPYTNSGIVRTHGPMQVECTD